MCGKTLVPQRRGVGEVRTPTEGCALSGLTHTLLYVGDICSYLHFQDY